MSWRCCAVAPVGDGCLVPCGPNKEHEPRWQTVWLHHSEQRVLGKLPFDGTAQQSRLSHQFHRRGAGDA